MFAIRCVLVGFVCAAGLLAGCDAADESARQRPAHHLETVRNAIRPTDGDGWQGNGYGAVEVFSLASPGGHFRVWYTTEGDDRVPGGDIDADGIPDFVELVAEHADTAWRVLIDEMGFAEPLDDAIYHDRPDYGGDGRFDIYLQNISQNDGYRVIEVCTQVPFQCAGYLVMENDFVGFNYPSTELAIKTLTTHEFAHGVVDAYDADVPQFVTEGFPTWAEEAVFPEQDDFEGFLRFFFDEPDRPLDAERPGDFSDLFPYATAIWPKFLEERFDQTLFREVLEGLVDTAGVDPEFWPTHDAVLRDRGSTVADAFTDFALWNLLTGRRAGILDGVGYADAAMYPEVPIARETLSGVGGGALLETSIQMDRLSAKYIAIPSAEFGGRTVDIEAFGRLRFVVLGETGGVATAPAILRPAGALDRAQVEVPAGGQLLIVAVNPSSDRVVHEGSLVITGEPVVVVDQAETVESDDVGMDAGTDVGPSQDLGPDAVAEPSAPSLAGGGCGCRVAAEEPTSAPLAAGLGFALVTMFFGCVRRRRSKA